MLYWILCCFYQLCRNHRWVWNKDPWADPPQWCIYEYLGIRSRHKGNTISFNSSVYQLYLWLKQAGIFCLLFNTFTSEDEHIIKIYFSDVRMFCCKRISQYDLIKPWFYCLYLMCLVFYAQSPHNDIVYSMDTHEYLGLNPDTGGVFLKKSVQGRTEPSYVVNIATSSWCI